jgi:hypothetical protein
MLGTASSMKNSRKRNDPAERQRKKKAAARDLNLDFVASPTGFEPVSPA